MSKEFYIISLGPGQPELITIQGLKALDECEIIFIPVRQKDLSWEGSVSYSILGNIYNNYKSWFKNSDSFSFIEDWEKKFLPLYNPMSYSEEAWASQVEQIAEMFNKQNKIGYVTLGDAALYSSAYYLLNIINSKYPEISENTKVIPGISSISYASAKVKEPLCLGDSILEVIPMHAEETQPTKVYMRLHKGDDVGCIDGDNVYSFENLGLENETIKKGTAGIIENYLTVIIDFAKPNIPTQNKEK